MTWATDDNTWKPNAHQAETQTLDYIMAKGNQDVKFENVVVEDLKTSTAEQLSFSDHNSVSATVIFTE